MKEVTIGLPHPNKFVIPLKRFNTSRKRWRETVTVNFTQSTEANTAWVTVSWYNERGQTGIASAPVNINLPAAMQLPRSKAIRIAA
jgi:hypothetical protein